MPGPDHGGTSRDPRRSEMMPTGDWLGMASNVDPRPGLTRLVSPVQKRATDTHFPAFSTHKSPACRCWASLMGWPSRPSSAGFTLYPMHSKPPLEQFWPVQLDWIAPRGLSYKLASLPAERQHSHVKKRNSREQTLSSTAERHRRAFCRNSKSKLITYVALLLPPAAGRTAGLGPVGEGLAS
jgi:hypothetical protein